MTTQELLVLLEALLVALTVFYAICIQVIRFLVREIGSRTDNRK